jgi:hypothetical protein
VRRQRLGHCYPLGAVNYELIAGKPRSRSRAFPSSPDALTVPLTPPATTLTVARSRRRLWPFAAAVLVAVIVGGLVLAARDDGAGSSPPSRNPPAVQPVPPGSTPDERAERLADWIRDHPDGEPAG